MAPHAASPSATYTATASTRPRSSVDPTADDTCGTTRARACTDVRRSSRARAKQVNCRLLGMQREWWQLVGMMLRDPPPLPEVFGGERRRAGRFANDDDDDDDDDEDDDDGLLAALICCCWWPAEVPLKESPFWVASLGPPGPSKLSKRSSSPLRAVGPTVTEHGMARLERDEADFMTGDPLRNRNPSSSDVGFADDGEDADDDGGTR
uniref:Uncharacterized protein n=1 Tax=Anopheles atroparvus TaxID=41427 RepID=A0A182J368_ANOAO